MQIESTDAVYMLGSQYVYIDKIHETRQVSYLGRNDICIAYNKIVVLTYMSVLVYDVVSLRKKLETCRSYEVQTFYAILFGLLSPEDCGIRVLWNIGNYSPHDAALHCVRFASSYFC